MFSFKKSAMITVAAAVLSTALVGEAQAHRGGHPHAPKPPRSAHSGKAHRVGARHHVRAVASHGAGWPAHGDARPVCHTYGYHGFESTAGYVETFAPSGYMSADPYAPYGARYSDQYVVFRLWAGWQDSAGRWQWNVGSFVRSRGGSKGGPWERQLADGRWVTTANGAYYTQSTSFVQLPAATGAYYVYGEYYWGSFTDPFGRTVFSGADHMEPLGYWSC
jgi:hypothetical protein